MFELKKTEGRARRGVFNTPHGAIETPFFMNVGTAAAIKGGISSIDLKGLKTQVELCNTYHLHLRPGDDIIYKLGGLHKFMNWDKPILTDSGGFQVFSLSKLRKIKEEGVYFASHIDGKRLFIGPEESMQIQSHLASTIAMAFDECIENPAPRDYVKRSVERTTRWLQRCKDEMARLNSLPETINKQQLLFGINQGGTYDDIRVEHMQTISEMDMDGYAIGGLAVGEPTEEMYHILDVVLPHAPVNKPRYLMGVGTPVEYNRRRLPRRGHVRLRNAQPQRTSRDYLYLGRHNARNQQVLRAGRASPRPEVRLPDLPQFQPRVYPTSFQGRGAAWRTSGGAA